MKSQKLPDAEFEIMETVWGLEPPVTSAMVMAAHGNDKGWKPQTALTLLSRLTERGFLRTEKGKGRNLLFYPAINREEYLKMETSDFVRHFHKKSLVSLLTALSSEDLSDQDLQELSDWMRREAKRRAQCAPGEEDGHA